MRVGGRFRFGHPRLEKHSLLCNLHCRPPFAKNAKDGAPPSCYWKGNLNRRAGQPPFSILSAGILIPRCPFCYGRRRVVPPPGEAEHAVVFLCEPQPPGRAGTSL